jgi:hypothetical protein
MESNSELLDRLARLAVECDNLYLDLSSSGRRFAAPISAARREVFSRGKEMCDLEHLNQMLTNFLDLAIKANNERDDFSKNNCQIAKQKIFEMLFEPEAQTIAMS